MDSAKLKENLFAVANRARGGRKRWGRILLAVPARVPPGAGTGTPLCCHHPAPSAARSCRGRGRLGGQRAAWGDKREVVPGAGWSGSGKAEAAGGGLGWLRAGWSGRRQVGVLCQRRGHRDTPDIPTCCPSRPQRPRGRQGDIWVPRGSASPAGSLVPVVPPDCRGCGATVPVGSVAA